MPVGTSARMASASSLPTPTLSNVMYRIVGVLDQAVIRDDRDACVLGLLNGRPDDRGVLGEDDQDVRALRQQVVHVGELLLRAQVRVGLDERATAGRDGVPHVRLVMRGPARLLEVVPRHAHRAIGGRGGSSRAWGGLTGRGTGRRGLARRRRPRSAAPSWPRRMCTQTRRSQGSQRATRYDDQSFLTPSPPVFAAAMITVTACSLPRSRYASILLQADSRLFAPIAAMRARQAVRGIGRSGSKCELRRAEHMRRRPNVPGTILTSMRGPRSARGVTGFVSLSSNSGDAKFGHARDHVKPVPPRY